MKNHLQLVAAACRLLVAGMLILSAVSHLDNPYLFLRSVHDYELLSSGIAQLTAAWIPWLQLVVATALVARLGGPGPKVVAVLLLGTFVIAQGWAYLNGSTASCGCFGYSMEAVGIKSIAIASVCAALAAFSLVAERDSFMRSVSGQADSNLGPARK